MQERTLHRSTDNNGIRNKTYHGIQKTHKVCTSNQDWHTTNLNAAVIPAGINLRDLYARTPMTTASVPLDANISSDRTTFQQQLN